MTGLAEIRVTLTALLIVFVVLKLAGLVDWSWWWVLAPFWVPGVLAVAIGAPVVIALLAKGRRKR